MSTDERLSRLGLLHLKDKPAELERELKKRVNEQRAQEEAWHEERKKLLAEKQKGASPKPAPAKKS